ncbi:hypothetical protein AURDEDRAFT_159764 [Auricularia subglabra TFB-10046 SS5]|nr:hypothetical protein AURDEDRAFT_159764 [Auricularia subglabra TFB-10046 SS5]
MPTYDGVEDLKKFEAFVYDWDSWIAPKHLERSHQITLMGRALTGKAKDWFMIHVALDNYAWTTQEIYQELYEKGGPIKDFAKELTNLAVRYPDIDEYALKHIFWDGVDPYIKLFWAERGRSLEYDDMPTLLIYAQRAEKREKMRPGQPNDLRKLRQTHLE